MSKILFAIAAVTVAGSVASADVVTFQYVGTSRGNNIGIATGGGSYHNVFAGSVIHNIDGDRAVTYCIEPDQWAHTGTTTFQRQTLVEALSGRDHAQAKAYAIADMVSAAGSDIWSESANKALATAFQIAVWEVVMDFAPAEGMSSLSLTAGNFKARGTNGNALSNAITGHVASFLNAISFSPAQLGGIDAFTNGGHQDFITAVPAPGPIALSLAALPLAVIRRRR